jgi:hypothetical protein
MTFPSIYVLYSKLVHLFHFSPFYFSSFLRVISIGFKISYSLLYRKYTNHIHLLYFLLLPSLTPNYMFLSGNSLCLKKSSYIQLKFLSNPIQVWMKVIILFIYVICSCTVVEMCYYESVASKFYSTTLLLSQSIFCCLNFINK